MQESSKIVNNQKQSDGLYIPSSSEKKRTMLMYVFFGLIISMSKKELSVFEYYHLKQALWWSLLFLVMLIIGLVLLFIPILKYISFIIIFVLAISWLVFVSDSWKWVYNNRKEHSPIMLFSSIWWRVLALFDINIKTYPDSDDSDQISSLQDLLK